MRVLVRTCVLLSAWFLGEMVLSQEQSAQNLLTLYERSHAVMESVEFELDARVYYTGGDFAKETLITTNHYKCLRDGTRWRIENLSLNTTPGPPGTEPAKPIKTEYLLTKQQMINVMFDGSQYAGNAQFQDLIAKSSQGISMLGGGGLLFGNAPGSATPLLADFLKTQPLTFDEDTVEGRAVFRIQTKGDYGEYRLWVDPSAEYLLCKLQIEKEAGDLGRKGKVAEIKTGKPMPEGNLNRWSFAVDKVRFAEHGNRKVMVGWETRETYGYAGGREFLTRGVLELTNVRVAPKFQEKDFAVSLPVPNGTSIFVKDDRDIDYEWRDGKVVKVVDDELVKNLEGHEFRGLFGSGISAWTVCFFAVNVVLVGALVWWYLRRKTPQSG